MCTYDARLSLVAAHARRPAGGSHDVAGLAVARCYARAIGEVALSSLWARNGRFYADFRSYTIRVNPATERAGRIAPVQKAKFSHPVTDGQSP